MGPGVIEIARHAPDHGELLPVLLPEQGDIGLHLIEQLGHHRGDAVKMARPRGAAQALAHTADCYASGKTRRIDFLHRGCPQQGDAFCLQ